jgi:hypothetical protein
MPPTGKDPIDLSTLEPGRRYRVDWKNDRLRRTFRAAGTLLRIEDDGDGPVLIFEVKPHFGAAAEQPITAASLVSVLPA